MATTKKTSATPRLRFPEFRRAGEWTATKLGELAELLTERVGTSTCTPYTITSGVGLISQQEKLGRTIAGNSIKNYIVLRRDDFAFNKSATKAYPEGYIARYTGAGRAAVPNSIFTCFRVNERLVNPVYLDYLFASNLHGRWLRKYIAVGARAHGSLNVNDDDLLGVPIPLPNSAASMQEQRKIADCLTSLDDVISTQAQKVEALKTHKQGLIQQLFPREGETVPRVRFSASETASSWHLTRLGDVLSEPKRKSDGKARVHSVSVHKGVIDQIEHLGRSFAAADTSKYSLVRPFDVIYTKSPTGDFPYGIVKQSHLDHDAIVSPLYGVFSPANEHVGRIIEAYFNAPQRAAKYLAPISTKGAKNTIQISNSKFLSKGIPLPSGEEEQRYVAGALASADECITAANAALEALRTHKKGLMQQIFPPPAAD